MPLEIEEEAIKFYLESGFFYQDSTPYKQVFAIPNAHYGILNLNTFQLSIKPYFKLESYYQLPKITKEQEALEQCESLLKQSIARRISLLIWKWERF